MEEDEREILYIALSNSIMYYNTLLDSDIGLPEEDQEMAQHLLDRQLHYLDKYAIEINEPRPIGRPKWK